MVRLPGAQASLACLTLRNEAGRDACALRAPQSSTRLNTAW
jgi:hypothetical protein